MTKIIAWVIEASESPVKNPDYFVKFSAGRCFLTWSSNYDFAMKFQSKQDAVDWMAKNRMHCGFRLVRHQIQIA